MHCQVMPILRGDLWALISLALDLINTMLAQFPSIFISQLSVWQSTDPIIALVDS